MRKIKRRLSAPFLAEIVSCQLDEDAQGWQLQFDYDSEAFARLLRERLGRTVLLTNRLDWTAEQVAAGYGGQQSIERVFRGLKDGRLAWLGTHASLDFVIPLHIDDLPHGHVRIELTRVNSAGFERSRAAGLASLLEKLELDPVPKSAAFDRSAVNQWWRTQFSASAGVRREEESYLSNRFPILYRPMSITIPAADAASGRSKSRRVY